MTAFASILWFFIVVEIDAWSNYAKIKSGKLVEHNDIQFAERFLWMLPSVILFGIAFGRGLHTYSMTEIIILPVFIGLLYFSSYWLVFDISLNLMRGKNIFYEGKPKPDDGDMDVIFREIPNWLTLPIKITLIIVSILIISTI